MALQCPWCKEPYDRFIPHDDADELPANACESELGFWIHSEDTYDE